jgi:hypothetical protein
VSEREAIAELLVVLREVIDAPGDIDRQQLVRRTSLACSSLVPLATEYAQLGDDVRRVDNVRSDTRYLRQRLAELRADENANGTSGDGGLR